MWCIKLDLKIERYKAMQSRILDKQTHEGIGDLVAELMAKKAQLSSKE